MTVIYTPRDIYPLICSDNSFHVICETILCGTVIPYDAKSFFDKSQYGLKCRKTSVSTAVILSAAANPRWLAGLRLLCTNRKTAAFYFKSRRQVVDFHLCIEKPCQFCGFFLLAAWQLR
jgi:hypothetical protein